MRRSTPLLSRVGVTLLLSLLLAAFPASRSSAQLGGGAAEDPIDMELRYADGLMQLGFPDYAKMVLGRLDQNVVGPRMKVLQLQSFLATGNFDEVKRLIAQEPSQTSPDTWAMKLALADGYYSWGQYGEARKLYQAFFRQYPSGPPESLKSFFLESAYKFAQMLILMGDDAGAVKAYEIALKAAPKGDEKQRHIRRQILGETMELMIKVAENEPSQRASCFSKVKDILDEILWVQDIWFGKAVVAMAHMRKMEGKIEEAMKLLTDYGPQLEGIDESLKKDQEETGDNLMRLSPMAEARYVLATILYEEAVRLQRQGGADAAVKDLLIGKKQGAGRTQGAVHHFAAVFAKYPYTSWAAKSGRKLKEIKELLQTQYGITVSVDVSEDKLEAVLRAQLTQARVLFTQNRFEDAADLYVDVLNDFPEGDASIAGLADLARCYMELGEEREIDTEMVVNYLVERFCRNKNLQLKAGDTLLNLAEDYDARERPDKREAIEKMFFLRFDDHPRVPGMIAEFGKRAMEAKDYETALGHYQRIIEKFADTKYYELAISRAANCSAEMGKPEEEQKYLEQLVTVLEKKPRPGNPLISTKFRLIAAQQQEVTRLRKEAETDEQKAEANRAIAQAAVSYTKLAKMLEDNPGQNSPYVQDPDDVKKNDEILQAATFYKALNYSLLTLPADKVKVFKGVAIKTFESLVDKWPESKFAPQSLSQIGTLWTVLEDAEKAEKALTRLQKEYPQSPEAKNSLATLAFNLLQLGMRTKAVEIFKKMFAEPGGKYTEGQILTAGVELADAGENEIALDAFNKVLAGTKNKGTHERALLGKGKVLCAMKKYAEASQALRSWLDTYPKSRNSVEASFFASTAYSEQGKEESDPDKRFNLFNEAVVAMRKVRMYDTSTAGRAKSDVGVAKIHLARAAAEAKFGSPEKAEAARGDAIVTLQSLIFFVNRSKAGVGPHLQDAYSILIPLLMEQGKWGDAVENCDAYIKEFADGKYLSDIRKYRTTSNMKAQMTGATGSGIAIPVAGEGTNVTVNVSKEQITGAAGQNEPAEKPDEGTKPGDEKKPEAGN